MIGEAKKKVRFSDIPKAISDFPEMEADLNDFVTFWGLDAYTPPQNVMESVRQIIVLSLNEARGRSGPVEGAIKNEP